MGTLAEEWYTDGKAEGIGIGKIEGKIEAKAEGKTEGEIETEQYNLTILL